MDLANFQKRVVCIAEKYADLVEKRIDTIKSLNGLEVRDVYESIQILEQITATLERFKRMDVTREVK